MKKIIYMLFLLGFQLKVVAQYTSIPDVNFEKWLQIRNLDSGALDGQVLTSAIDTVQFLDLSRNFYVENGNIITYENLDIHDLTGIENFTSLKNLYAPYQPITVLDLSSNTALEILNLQTELETFQTDTSLAYTYLTVPHPSLGSLDLSHNINLKEVYLRRCGLTAINFGQIVNLEQLNVEDNNISSLDLSYLLNLKFLRCGSNDLTTLDLYNNINLEGFAIFPFQFSGQDSTTWHRNNLQNIVFPEANLSKLSAFRLANCWDETMTTMISLDLSAYQYLIAMYFVEAPIYEINIANGNNNLSGNTFLSDFHFSCVNQTAYTGLSVCVQVDDQTIADAANNGTLDYWNQSANITYSTNCSTAGIPVVSDSTLAIYPNPSNGFYNISMSSTINTISCYNALGQEIACDFTANTVAIPQAKQGIYYLKIKTNDGLEFVKKIMKK